MSSDPVERIIADALDKAGIAYVCETDQENSARLDFYLPDTGIYIEAKRMASDRSAEQLRRANNVILVQGLEAARALASWIAAKEPSG